MSNSFYHYAMRRGDEIKNSIALRGKNVGCSLKLRGRIVLIAFLVDDAESKWSNSDVRKFIDCFQQVSTELMEDSGLSTQELCISVATSPASIPYVADRRDPNRFVKDILKKYGFASIEAYQRYYEKNFPCNDCCVSFVFNKPFRSYAAHVVSEDKPVSTPYPHGDEYSVVAFYPDRIDYSKNVLIHELMHQFGAIDYYFPSQVEAAAKRYLPDSIMLGGNRIDQLTRYIIGWDSTLSANAKAFLNAIAHLTDEDFERAKKAEWAKTKK